MLGALLLYNLYQLNSFYLLSELYIFKMSHDKYLNKIVNLFPRNEIYLIIKEKIKLKIKDN